MLLLGSLVNGNGLSVSIYIIGTPDHMGLSLLQGSTIRLDHSAAEGQTRENNDFGRRHHLLVTGRKAKGGTSREAKLGGFHALPVEL